MAISLGDRLRHVVSGTVPRVSMEPNAPAACERAEAHVARAAPPLRDGPRIADVLGGVWRETVAGNVLTIDRYYAPDRLHGRTPVGRIVETLENGQDALHALGRAWPGRDARPYSPTLCFFDIETTGLAGGAGTQAFLIGCARIEDGGLRVRQFLLAAFHHEPALLAQLGEWLLNSGTPCHRADAWTAEETPTLVTFNGRTFDIPLVETRYLFHRLPFPLADVPHLDMLHPARRLWKQRPTVAGPALDDDSCRLAVLERHLAGYHRVGDVPGFDIPSRYFRFIREGDAYGLEAVLEHNRIDLISLAVVTARAVTLIQTGPAAASHPREALGLGCVYERAGMPDNAEASYAHAAAWASRVGREPDVQADALRRLALCRRRTGRLMEAATAWQELLAVPACPSRLRREAREALAIHHEHRSRDLQSAKMFVMDVLAEGAGPRTRADAEHRLRRIERKLSQRCAPLQLEA